MQNVAQQTHAISHVAFPFTKITGSQDGPLKENVDLKIMGHLKPKRSKSYDKNTGKARKYNYISFLSNALLLYIIQQF